MYFARIRKSTASAVFTMAVLAICTSTAMAAGASNVDKLSSDLANMNPLVRLLSVYWMGLLLAFSPCIYPMIGVTLGYFGAQKGYDGKKSALLAGLYVVGIAITYSVLGTLAALAGGVLGSVMQNHWVIGGLSLLLVALALSMFGLYEINPPQALASKSSAKSGILGALAMGLLFGLVASPCVAPFIGALAVYVAKTQSVFIGFSSFFVMALGMGTPLFILALTATRLPAPGNWMVAVKRIGGFLLIGAAAYFMLPIVPNVIGKYLMPAVLVASGIYLGFFEKSLRTTSRMQTFSTLVGILLIISGMFWALPKNASTYVEATEKLTWTPYSAKVIEQAAKEGKPVMLDFYADWCGVCQEYETGAFKDPDFIKESQRFVRVRVDYTNKNDEATGEVVTKYEVIGFPTLIFFDSSGKQVSDKTLVGKQDTGVLIDTLKSIK